MYVRKNTHTRLIADELDTRWRTPGDELVAASTGTPVWVRLRGAPGAVKFDRAITGAEIRTLGIEAWAPWLSTDVLSKREVQVFLALATGQGVSQIAESQHLSVKTVSTYRSRVVEKTGLRNEAEFAVYAFQNGLVKWGRLPAVPPAEGMTASEAKAAA
jgi:DNA-binding CsgD family transcriptional regulator